MIVSMMISALLGACVVTPVGYRYHDDGYDARGGHRSHHRNYPHRGHPYDRDNDYHDDYGR
jgi:hypothetical protein